MRVIVLAEGAAGREIQLAVENLGEEWRCDAPMTAARAQELLQQGAEVLLLCQGREGVRLLAQLEAQPPLAPPWVLGWGTAAPDGRLTAIDALPAWCSGERLPVLANRHLPAAQALAGALLRSLGVPGRLRAWAFLPEMIGLTVVHPLLLADVQHGLYPLIAERHGMTAAGVERSLRLCVESTWSRGSLEALERFFGASVDPERGKPTNREFLCRMQERVTLAMGRLLRGGGQVNNR